MLLIRVISNADVTELMLPSFISAVDDTRLETEDLMPTLKLGARCGWGLLEGRRSLPEF